MLTLWSVKLNVSKNVTSFLKLCKVKEDKIYFIDVFRFMEIKKLFYVPIGRRVKIFDLLWEGLVETTNFN